MSDSSDTPPNFPSPDRKILTNRAGGPDSLQFAELLSTMFEKDPNSVTIGFRERDFSYFAVEDWGPPHFTPECVKFQGEIPCLYVIRHPGSSAQTPPTDIPPSFFTLVDYVAQTTGSGLGIRVTGDPLETTNLRTDLRTGLRVRYRFTPVPREGGGAPKYYWVERTESGRGGSYRTVSAQRRGP